MMVLPHLRAMTLIGGPSTLAHNKELMIGLHEEGIVL
jgi:hypothetical protein